MKLGVFGGTFNPIHNGHLINAQYIRHRYSLDRILFIPSKYPVHKKLDFNIKSSDRLRMIELAVDGGAGLEVARIEIDREEKSFTIITARQLLEIYPGAELYLIIGSDAFNEIDTWKDYRDLVKITSIIVIRRNGSAVKYKKAILKIAREVIFADNPVIEISSSIIRENIRNGLPVKYLLPQSVEKYIIDTELYRN